jgi:hypothetical protein
MFNSPEALRSERFILSKLEIEQSAIGDNLVGLHNASEVRTADTLPIAQIENRSEATDG